MSRAQVDEGVEVENGVENGGEVIDEEVTPAEPVEAVEPNGAKAEAETDAEPEAEPGGKLIPESDAP